jgi:hypothetical protein
LTFKYFVASHKSKLRMIPDIDPVRREFLLGFKQLARRLHAGEAGRLRAAALLAAGAVISIS